MRRIDATMLLPRRLVVDVFRFFTTSCFGTDDVTSVEPPKPREVEARRETIERTMASGELGGSVDGRRDVPCRDSRIGISERRRFRVLSRCDRREEWNECRRAGAAVSVFIRGP